MVHVWAFVADLPCIIDGLLDGWMEKSTEERVAVVDGG